MNVQKLVVVAILVNSSIAIAADSIERSSPLDDNPQCMDRKNKDCVVKDDGTGRHVHLMNKLPETVKGSSGPRIAGPTVGRQPTSK